MSAVEGQQPRGAPAAEKCAASDWTLAEYAVWVLPVAAYFLFPTYLPLLGQVAIMALFALSLDLLLGRAGIVSLGHGAFFGLGAYAAGLLGRHGWGEPLTGLVASGLVAGAFGWLSSFLVLRGADLTRLLVTLGIALMLSELANKMSWLTGGSDGLQGIRVSPILGVWDFDLHGRTGYIYATVVLFILFVIARRIVYSPFGWSLKGIKENERRMLALGAPVARRIVAIYTIAAAYAGVAGGLLAQTTQFVSLEALSFHKSAEVLLMVVLGGAGHLYGALFGALAFMLAQHALSAITPQYWQFWMGAMLVLLVMFARGGAAGLFMALGAAIRQRRAPRGPGGTAP
jgi:branched-chain amino acid transport system permease protein